MEVLYIKLGGKIPFFSMKKNFFDSSSYCGILFTLLSIILKITNSTQFWVLSSHFISNVLKMDTLEGEHTVNTSDWYLLYLLGCSLSKPLHINIKEGLKKLKLLGSIQRFQRGSKRGIMGHGGMYTITCVQKEESQKLWRVHFTFTAKPVFMNSFVIWNFKSNDNIFISNVF